MTGGGSYQVKILLDISVLGVKSYLKDHPEALHSGDESVTGVEGKQTIGLKDECSLRFNSKPEEVFEHSLHPIKMDRNEDLVILGRDFLGDQ